MDATRTEAAAGREIEVRWREHEVTLARTGASPETLALLGERVLPATGRAGHVGRLVVADRDGIALDLGEDELEELDVAVARAEAPDAGAPTDPPTGEPGE